MRPASAEEHKGRSTTLFLFIVTLHRNRPQKPDVGQRVGADIYMKSVYPTLVLDLQKSGSF